MYNISKINMEEKNKKNSKIRQVCEREKRGKSGLWNTITKGRFVGVGRI
jgi:hypothetical protein